MIVKNIDSSLVKLLINSNKQRFSKGQIVRMFEDNAMLNFITSGYVKRYRITDEGSQNIQVIFGPGQIFPLTPVYKSLFNYDMYSGPEEYYYETITPVTAHSIGQNELKQKVSQNPELYRDLFYAAGLRLDSYIHRLEGNAQKSASQSVAWQLTYLASTFGSKTNSGVEIDVPITHQLLADILGFARETVTHSMAELSNERLVLIKGRRIIIPDLEKLRLHK